MTLEEYEKEAERTRPGLSALDNLACGALGLTGEAGEVADLVKKHIYQGHKLDREKLILELGDVSWYLAQMCAALGVSMSDMLQANVSKLQKRYPKGFDVERSVNRGGTVDG